MRKSMQSLLVRLFAIFSFLVVQAFTLNKDGIFLLSFKSSVLKDPLYKLQNWNPYDETPCYWNGVKCSPSPSSSSTPARVIELSLPSSGILGSISPDLGLIENLQSLNLSNNSFNGSLPTSFFNATKLQILDLSGNLISGELPESISRLRSLQVLNISDNALAGKVPGNLTVLSNLTVVSLQNNYFSGSLYGGFGGSVQFLDLSSNLINGSLPSDFGGDGFRYFNISYNKLSGMIPGGFSENIPDQAVLDFSFNNLSGEIPQLKIFTDQKTSSFSGNPDLCGLPTKIPCPIVSSPAFAPNVTGPSDSPPAIAAIPKMDPNGSDRESNSTGSEPDRTKQIKTWVKPTTIIAIVFADIAGIGILLLIFSCICKSKRKSKNIEADLKREASFGRDNWSTFSPSEESGGFTKWSCLRKRGNEEEKEDDADENSETGSGEEDHTGQVNQGLREQGQGQGKRGTLVTVDGEKELELETLLMASAYILGATGSSIMYKAVLEDGTSLAVRRIGESHVERFKEFESQVKIVAKLVHPNLIRVRGFYWGVDEKLIIYDFVPNGSLANARYRKVGSSPCHLPWESRLKIAKGIARGLAYLHEKKHIHGNLKPSNILLGDDLEPKIGDFGLEKLLPGDTSYKSGGSARHFGSKRSTASRDSFQDLSHGPSPSPSPSSIGLSLYHAPESLRSIKPNPKWDVYSFGVILLELLTGKVIVLDEMGLGLGLAVEDKNRALRMADVSIRTDVEGREDILLSCFKLGYSCASPTPQKRPSMKEALQTLEKLPSLSSPYGYYVP